MKFAYFARPRVADGSPPSPMLGRTATALGIAAGCYAITMAVLGTTISLFLADAVRVGPELIGLYFTGCAVAAIAINLAAGWLSDRLADRRVALAATALAGVAGALIFIEVRNYAVVFATGAVLLGLNDAYISQLFAYVKEFAESTGREVTPFSSAVRSVFSAGWVIGPPVGFLLLTQIGFGLMYAGAAALLLLTALLGRWFLPALPSPPGPTAKDNADGRSSGLRRVYATVPRRTWLLLGSVTAVNVANQIYLINIALYVTGELHLSAAPVGLMAGTCAALEIPLMITVGRLADRIGKMRVMAAALVVAVMFFCLLPVAGSVPVLIALQLPNAVWIAVMMSVPMVVVQQEVPGGAGTASALYSSTFPVAQLLAGAITGVVAAQAGYRNVFWFCACLVALALVLLLCRMASRNPTGIRHRPMR
ncbi:sugar efflux transporter [Streptomyces sp. NBC_00683]|uniref:sugar efflux transporter n=1 Tax=Streptomyces sp. NBC_00683 TaxID=2903670 RepID=UPI002E3331F9|nr:sugar efflux transporter [Streptomyces sp. NBC_00683]